MTGPRNYDCKPTDRQLEVLRFIATHLAEQGYPPTMREIAARLGVGSVNGVNDHLGALERKGCLVRRPLLRRTLTVTPRGLAALAAQQPPVVGGGAA